MESVSIDEEQRTARRKRVKRLKKIILALIFAAIFIPILISVILGIRLQQVSSSLQDATQQIEELLKQVSEQEKAGVYNTTQVEESERMQISEDNSAVDSTEKTGRQIYLTFDDGPSRNTAKILDILAEYDIKATFFVQGKTDESSKNDYQRIVEEGHTLGMHSYSHQYGEIYQSVDSFAADMKKLQEYLYDTTGVWSRYYRFPGGSSNTVSQVDMQELIAYLKEQGITYYDWNIASGDAASGYLDAQSIADNCLSKIEDMHECMILLHDANDKSTTVEALPIIIEEIQAMEDTAFYPISDDTVPVQHIASN